MIKSHTCCRAISVVRFVAIVVLACIVPLITPVITFAQDADGNDRPSNWVVTYQQAYGIWDTVCDQRGDGEAREKRCYIRHVDVFSPRPNFAAQFLFVTNADGVSVQFGIEPGTLFLPGRFRLQRGGDVVWSTRHPGCLTGVSCAFDGEAALELLTEMVTGGTFAFDFRDRHGASQSLRWSLEGFAAALDDFNTQSTARELPPISLTR